MQHSVLVNQLRITDAPMSNFYWSKVMSDPIIQDTFAKSKLYILTQRPVLSFRNVTHDNTLGVLKFEIHQGNMTNHLTVTLPLVQEYIVSDLYEPVCVRFGTIYPPGVTPHQDHHSLMVYRGAEHLITLWPERLLLFKHRGWIEADVVGDPRSFLKYKVLYVGKAIDQRVWERLDGHSTLQRILSEEQPLINGDLPTHEIALMFLEFHDNMSIQIIDKNSVIEQIESVLNGTDLPTTNRIYTDAEKALISALQPGYNKVRYKKYPKNKGGLYQSGLDTYSYTFMDPVTLEYNGVSIRGGINYMGGDAIIIQGDTLYVCNQERTQAANE